MIRQNLTRLIWVWLLILSSVFPAAVAAQGLPGSKPPIKIEVQTHPAEISPGQQVWVAVNLTIDPGWHIYGNPKGPGPGLPTILEVTSLPDSVRADLPRFLPAEKLVEQGFEPDEWVWAYKGRTTIYLPLSTTGELSPGLFPVRLHFRTLICREGLCLPYQTDLVTTLSVVSVTKTETRIPPAVLKDINRTHAAETEATAQTAPVALAPLESAKERPPVALKEIPQLQPRPVHRGLEVGSLVKATLFALLAGLILNFTPCVLPVVSLKILGFIQQAQGSRRRVALMGLSFSAGIFAVFLVLAALASFAGYGWGDLFQKQSFLLVMIALVFSLSLCLFGVFQLPIPHFATSEAGISLQRQGYWESFYKGTLATFLATPCSGPLLGGAMAWTLRQSPLQIFAVFACLGLGMASPYVVMSLFPATLRWLPRPGAWLIHFERLMGFALLASVVYLLTILSETMRVWVILFCLFLALGLYVWGQMTSLTDSTRRRVVVRFVALIIMVAGGWLSLALLPSVAGLAEGVPGLSSEWQPYTDMKLLAAAEENRWVVIDFTADWCPNCILVEKAVLEDRKVVKAFREHDALLLKADLTRENPPAKRLLKKMGSRSIPFLALFPPGQQFWQPFFLRDLYQVEDVLQVFSKVAGRSNSVQRPD
ncbi:MAG: thioredoxin family protein [Deltaproteobacteria bacterium]|nr:MAG: thioredoxin family protein [Deltaproteobacteria bacterium]